MKLNLDPLGGAIKSLERAVERSLANPEDEEVRDAVIQRFEYTMDLSWKMIQRHLKREGVSETAIRTKRDLFREGARVGLIDEPEQWFGWLEARNETSHVYSPIVARRVYEKALEFVKVSRSLLDRLEAANRDSRG